MTKLLKQNYWLITLFLIGCLAFFLRTYQINNSPPSLYWEEAALGYDAYSVLKTGADHHGNPWPVTAFESFGDWKPSGYFYALIPSIWLLGLSSLAVKLPSILAGTGLVVGTSLLALQIGAGMNLSQKQNRLFGMITAILAAVSPWGILLSRVGFETNLATCLVVWGAVTLGLVFRNNSHPGKGKLTWLFYFVSPLLFAAAAYTYHATRISSPLIMMLVICFYLFSQKFTKKNLIQAAIPFVIFMFLALPLISSYFSGNQLSNRFAETSIFSNIEVIEQSNQLRAANNNSMLSRLVYHRYVLFGKEMATNALSHFSTNFLFIDGDENLRHSTGIMGQMYPIELLFIALGGWWVFRKRAGVGLFLIGWLAIAVLPSSVTLAVPHALRAQLIHPALLILASLGLVYFFDLIKKSHPKLFIPSVVAVISIYVFMTFFFMKYLTQIYPVVTADQWQFGYQQMIEKLNFHTNQLNPEKIVISREMGRPVMYYWFYSQTDPTLVQQNDQAAIKDQSEVLSYQNVYFVRDADELNRWTDLTNQTQVLVASSPMLRTQLELIIPNREIRVVDEIRDLRNNPVWEIYLIN